MANSWFTYTGGGTGDPHNYLDYTKLSGLPACPDCSIGCCVSLCAIYATVFSTGIAHPIITPEPSVAIDNAINGENSPYALGGVIFPGCL